MGKKKAKDPRSFWERLLRRKEKNVLNRDENGEVTGQTAYKFDKYGKIIDQMESKIGPQGQLIPQTHRTFQREADGSYLHNMTTYFDQWGRAETEKHYFRDARDILTADQKHYSYIAGKQLVDAETRHIRIAGDWFKQSSREYDYDGHGECIHKSNYEYSSVTHGMVCMKDKTYVRRDDGTYDPLKTTYRDETNRITKENEYFREETGLGLGDNGTLFCHTKKWAYRYQKGDQGTVTEDTAYLVSPAIGWDDAQGLLRLMESQGKKPSEKLKAMLERDTPKEKIETVSWKPPIIMLFGGRKRPLSAVLGIGTPAATPVQSTPAPQEPAKPEKGSLPASKLAELRSKSQ